MYSVTAWQSTKIGEDMTFKEILEKYGVTASELSRRSGVSTSTLSTFVNGRSQCQNMQISTFLRICKGLDIPFETFVEDLFDGKEGSPGKEALLSGDEESLVSDFRGFNAQAKSCLMRVSSAMKLDPSNMRRNRDSQVEAALSADGGADPNGSGRAD